jgi:antitoxin (DNA-binding transcriptional repressor) of toxin-antitoxin stability system
MKTVGVRDLKAHLSAYLRDVARGERLLVTDRGRIVAELRQPGAAERSGLPEDLLYHQLVERGVLRPAPVPGSMDWSGAPAVRLERGTAQELLDRERAE